MVQKNLRFTDSKCDGLGRGIYVDRFDLKTVCVEVQLHGVVELDTKPTQSLAT